jgi:hypothetical protein
MDAEQPETAVGAANDYTEIITRESVQLYQLAWSDEGDGPEEPQQPEPERVPRNFLPWRQAWRRAATIASVGAVLALTTGAIGWAMVTRQMDAAQWLFFGMGCIVEAVIVWAWIVSPSDTGGSR